VEAEVVLERTIEAVTLLRGWRDSVGARAGLTIPVRLNADGYGETAQLLARLARLDLSVTFEGGDTPVASIPIPGGTVDVLSGDGVDLGAAKRRRDSAAQKLLAEIERVESKLGRPEFLEKAPAAVVEGERKRLERLRAKLAAL
jgi:valyl-tRNA synthetase